MHAMRRREGELMHLMENNLSGEAFSRCCYQTRWPAPDMRRIVGITRGKFPNGEF